MQASVSEGTHLSLNITHQQQLKANPSLTGAPERFFSGKIPKQSRLDNPGGAQRPAKDWRELLGRALAAVVPAPRGCWAPVAFDSSGRSREQARLCACRQPEGKKGRKAAPAGLAGRAGPGAACLVCARPYFYI